jgi:hypothetical protein
MYTWRVTPMACADRANRPKFEQLQKGDTVWVVWGHWRYGTVVGLRPAGTGAHPKPSVVVEIMYADCNPIRHTVVGTHIRWLAPRDLRAAVRRGEKIIDPHRQPAHQLTFEWSPFF